MSIKGSYIKNLYKVFINSAFRILPAILMA